MTRVVTVLLVAVLMAEMFGLGGVSLARQPQPAQGAPTRRPEVVQRLGQIPPGSVVKIERIDGTKLDAYLEEVTPDTITVTILAKTSRAKETIPIEDIKKIEEAHGHTLRNILLGVGIGLGVAVAVVAGSCAASGSRVTMAPVTRGPQTSDGESEAVEPGDLETAPAVDPADAENPAGRR